MALPPMPPGGLRAATRCITTTSSSRRSGSGANEPDGLRTGEVARRTRVGAIPNKTRSLDATGVVHRHPPGMSFELPGSFVRAVLVVSALSLGGCSVATAALKSQIDGRCKSVGVKGCPEIADGVIAYADGKDADAEAKLRSAAALNSPEQLRQFTKVLEPLIDAADEDLAKKLRPALAILKGEGVGTHRGRFEEKISCSRSRPSRCAMGGRATCRRHVTRTRSSGPVNTARGVRS